MRRVLVVLLPGAVVVVILELLAIETHLSAIARMQAYSTMAALKQAADIQRLTDLIAPLLIDPQLQPAPDPSPTPEPAPEPTPEPTPHQPRLGEFPQVAEGR